MKLTLCFAFITLMAVSSNAQQGNNQVQIAAELGIPVGKFADAVKTGFGGSAKGLFGVGSAGQISLTSGYTRYELKHWEYSASYFSIIPILAGYRQIFNGFYVEPQAGVGIYGIHFGDNSYSDDSRGVFTWGGGVGYDFKGLDICVRFQSAKLKDEFFSYSLIGIHAGYNISF